MMVVISQEQIKEFQNHILKWYKVHKRYFPWRVNDLTDYQYIVAEVLLQRTRAETVDKFYPLFIDRFPNWKSISDTDLSDLEYFLKPVGLYTQRAKRLHSLAVEMMKRNEALPENRVELESIPFMGQYIANAVELIIFKVPSPLLDVNMARVLERFFGKRKLVDIRHDSYLQKLAYQVINHKNSKDLNWAILDIAAMICRARNPHCEKCPVRENCLYALTAI